jgi:hypothetical protein
MNKYESDEVLQLLEKHELSIATLYETFGSVLLESKNAWMAIAHEERLHAKWINTLSKYVKDGKIAFEKTKITTQSIKTAIDYIENQKNKTLREKSDLKQCLNIAINIEKALLENAFFRVFKLDVPATQKIRTRLEEETKGHIEKLVQWRERIIKS